jgi:hypothetical protein
MPKPKLPPQGGEKWLCLGMFLTIMFSVVMVVTLIYSTVIIYLPSIEEMTTNIVGPKRCTTTLVQRNITGTPEDGICSWSSCEEWCLSKGASPCSKVFGVLRYATQFLFYSAPLLPLHGQKIYKRPRLFFAFSFENYIHIFYWLCLS